MANSAIKSLQKAAGAAAATRGRLEQEIDLVKIKPDPNQPRKTFEAEALKALAQSLKDDGQVYPLIVSPAAGGVFHLIDGERRWRAMTALGQKTAQCLIMKTKSGADAAVSQLLLNIAREQITPDEQAVFLHQLKRKGLKQAEMAQRLQKSKGEISKMLTVGAFLSATGPGPDKVRKMLKDGRLVGLSPLYTMVSKIQGGGDAPDGGGGRVTRQALGTKENGTPKIAVGGMVRCRDKNWRVKAVRVKDGALVITAV